MLAGVTPLKVTATGTSSESKKPFHERIMLFCALTQHQRLNSPFHLHVNTQIEADTLYLVRINPGNQDQEFSTITYPMSLSCGAKAVNKSTANKKEIKELHACLLWALMRWHTRAV